MNNDDLITLNSNSQNEPKICRALCEKLDFFFKDPHFSIVFYYLENEFKNGNMIRSTNFCDYIPRNSLKKRMNGYLVNFLTTHCTISNHVYLFSIFLISKNKFQQQ